MKLLWPGYLLEFHISAAAFVEVIQASVLTFTTSNVLPRGGVIELSLPGARTIVMRDSQIIYIYTLTFHIYVYIAYYVYTIYSLCI